MQIYPAIDLKQGQAVRLLQGDFDKMTVYEKNPAIPAQNFKAAGCKWIHVVDLDGALKGGAVNHEAVKKILETGLKIQLGGGIRDRENIESWLEIGIERVVLGTVALNHPQLVIDAAKEFAGKIAVGADARGGMIRAEGWMKDSTVAVGELAKRFEDCGVAAIIFTDIERDGALGGVNIEATAALADSVSIPIIASGGVSDIGDIKNLLEADTDNIDGGGHFMINVSI